MEIIQSLKETLTMAEFTELPMEDKLGIANTLSEFLNSPTLTLTTVEAWLSPDSTLCFALTSLNAHDERDGSMAVAIGHNVGNGFAFELIAMPHFEMIVSLFIATVYPMRRVPDSEVDCS